MPPCTPQDRQIDTGSGTICSNHWLIGTDSPHPAGANPPDGTARPCRRFWRLGL